MKKIVVFDPNNRKPITEAEQLKSKLYRPRKKAISIRLDLDILFWLKSKGGGYQTRINSILREAMLKSKQS